MLPDVIIKNNATLSIFYFNKKKDESIIHSFVQRYSRLMSNVYGG
ncbi:hypothetical protein OAT71_00160 [Flavobacteriales bacterium]|nr:hypothetical protein [Flavobacteriales bacterium]